MIVSPEYIQMCKASEEIQEMRKGGLLEGDYYMVDDERLSLHKTTTQCNKTWIPRIDQLFLMIPDLIDKQTGSRSVLECLSGAYFIPNKKKTYNELEEHLIAYVMYRLYKKIWIPKLDKNGEETRWNHWYEEKKIWTDKLRILIDDKVVDESIEIRTTPVVENGVIVGMKTEEYKFDFESGKVIVLDVKMRMSPKKI